MEKKTLSLLEQMKLKSQAGLAYGGETKEEGSVAIRDCSNCGSARAPEDGLTHCAYCGFEFLSPLTEGVYLNENNNSDV